MNIVANLSIYQPAISLIYFKNFQIQIVRLK